MKVILIGYPGSQRIVPASKYLTSKYLNADLDIVYLNYRGKINGWSAFVSGYLTALKDVYVIFALDDYLVSGFNKTNYYKSFMEIMGDTVCVKLCQSTPEEHAEYPVTTQYCLWNREYLIWLLEHVCTPWEFEIHGSKIFNKVCLHRPCIEYFTNSSISSRWEGVRLDGLKEVDKKYIHDNKLIG